MHPTLCVKSFGAQFPLSWSLSIRRGMLVGAELSDGQRIARKGTRTLRRSRSVEQTVDVPVSQIVTKIPEVVETIPQERIWCMFEEPQVAAKILEVIKVPQIDDYAA